MFFVFSGEKKNVALLILVVVFGMTFGASLAKNQLEACHLLEGTQDDLATRNSSNAKAENWKEGTMFNLIDTVALNLTSNRSHFGCFAKTSSVNRSYSGDYEIHPFGKESFRLRLSQRENNTNFSYYFRPMNRSGVEPFSKTAYQMPTLLKVLGKACDRAIWTSMIAMRDFCVNWDKIYQGYLDGDRSVGLPQLSREEWIEVMEERETKTRNNENFETNFPPDYNQIVMDIALLSCAYMFDFWRICLWSFLTFVSYSNVLNIALLWFFLVVSLLGYNYLFERKRSCGEYFYEMNVQGTEEVWQRIMQRSIPGREIYFTKRRIKGMYTVTGVIKMGKAKVRYVSSSDLSYDDAFVRLAAKFPKKESEIVPQGVLRAMFGIRETKALKFVKSTVFFVYFYWRSRTIVDRIVACTNWIDQLLDLGMSCNIDIRLCDFYRIYQALPIITQNMKSVEKSGMSTLQINIDFDSDSEPEDNFGRDIQPEGTAEFASMLNVFFRGVFNSSSIRACFRLVSLIWHMLFVFKDGKVDWDHLSKWDTAMFNSIPEKAMNIGNTLLEQITNLALCSWEFYRTGDVNVFLRNDNEVSSFLEAVEKVANEVKNVPIEPKLPASITDLERRIHDLIQLGETLRPKVKMNIRPAFTSGLMQLRSLALEVCTLARGSSTRAAPFTVLVTGAPKIGKSSITSLIFKQFQITNPYNTVLGNGLVLHDNGVYTRTLKEEYWSCYMNSHWGILYDDLGQTNPKVAEFALEINEIIQVVNNIMYFPPMASVEEKGKRLRHKSSWQQLIIAISTLTMPSDHLELYYAASHT